MKQEHKRVYAFVEVIDDTVRIHQVLSEEMLKVMRETAEDNGHTYLCYSVDDTTHSATQEVKE